MTWLTKDGLGKSLCNFEVRVISIDNIYRDGAQTPVVYIRVTIDFGDDSLENAKEYSIPVQDIEKTPWEELDMRCCYEPSVSKAKVKRYINMLVRQKLEKASKRTVYQFSHAGMHIVEGKPVFCTGTDVIHDNSFASDILFEVEPINERMDVDEKLSEEDAAAELFLLLCLSPDPARVLLAYKLGFFMRLAYRNIGKVPKGCIYLYGQSGMQKTTFSSYLMQTFDRSKGIKSPPRLDVSGPAAVNMLQGSPNDVVIMDDLCPADSKRIRKQQEETLIEITRYIADGTIPARMNGKKLLQGHPQCGVVFTGEYLIGKGSDAARLLPVEMTKPDVVKLRYFQEHPLIVSTFYRYYITWYIEHYDDVCDILKQLREKYDQSYLNVHDRLKEMYFLLGSSNFLFLQYLSEIHLLEKPEVIRLYQTFNRLLVTLIEQQNERVQMGVPERFTKVDYWERICELYRKKQFRTADSVDEFDKKQHDSVVHSKCLYIRGECLEKFFPDVSLTEVVDELERKGVLQVGKNTKTKQICRLKGMRFYVIPLKYLSQSGFVGMRNICES